MTLENVTDSFTCQILSGPNSRDILAEVTDADLSLPWLSHQSCQIAGRWLQLVRVSFAGELGWELHTKVEDTAAVFDAVWAAGQKHGLKPFGMFALDSLRLEKGYRAWKQDLSTDYTILQGGLERFVKWDKPEFTGKAALLRRKAAGREEALRHAGRRKSRRMRRALHVDALARRQASSARRCQEAGATGWTNRSRSACCAPILPIAGTEVEVEIFGERFKATVQKDEPLWDPRNERLKG